MKSAFEFWLGIYDEAFFEGIDGVTNALDNIKARVYDVVSLPFKLMCRRRW